MISKAVLCHTLVIWGLAQVTTQVSINRGGIPAGVRSSMIANGWRPLTGYEGKSSGAHHSSISSANSNNGGSSIIDRHSGPHPVHGKLQEHMASSEKLAAKQKKKTSDYSPPSILGSFGVFGHSVPKVRNEERESPKGNPKQVASETREFSFLVPPPRDPVRYDVDPYRKVILRDNDAYLRQPGQYIISHSVPQTDIRGSQFFPKGGGVSVSASSHILSSLKNRPSVSEYNPGIVQGPQQHHQPIRQQHVPFESLKLSNAKLYLQPPSGNGPLNFASEQQASDTLYSRYPTPPPQHNGQISHDGPGNFYSQINHPSPNYKGHSLDRDPSFLVHESHEVSYATPASPGIHAYADFRPSTPYDSLFPPQRHSTARPSIVHPEKFVPSKTDNVIHQPNGGFGQYPQNGNGNLENTIISSEPTYSNGIANTYYISEQQSLTPPAPTWSVSVNNKVTPDINEVLPKTSRPPKFNSDPPNIEEVRQKNRQQIADYLFPRPEVHQKQQRQQLQQQQHQQQQQQQQQHEEQQQQLQHQQQRQQQQQQQHHEQQQQQLQHQHFASNPLALINQQDPVTVYETPESISLKHFNEQQFKLQQQLLQRDRDRLREQELQRQQQEIDFGRITSTRNKEKTATASTRPTQAPETPKPTVQYIDTTVNYGIDNNQGQNQEYHFVNPQQTLQPEYQESPFQPLQFNVEHGVAYETSSISPVSDGSVLVTDQPDHPVVTQETTEAPATGHRNRPRKPTAGSTNNEQQHRRRKPTTTQLYEEHQQQQYEHVSTLAPNPIVQSPGSSFPQYQQQQFQYVSTLAPNPTFQSPSSTYSTVSSTEEPTTEIRVTTPLPETTQTTSTSTTRPRTRRPTGGGPTGGRRRRPTTTTTQEPDTIPPVTYEQPDLYKYKKVESDASRRRRIKPSTTVSHNEESTTSNEKKRYEIKNYGNKLGQNEPFGGGEYVTESATLPEDHEAEQVSQSYAYTNEQDVSLYTPTYDTQVTTGQEPTEYETSGYPTSTTFYSTQNSPTEQQYDHLESGKNVHTSIPLEELFINTEKITTTTTTAAPPTTTTEPTTTAPTTRNSPTKSSRIATTSAESVANRTPSHRMRPMRFGNTTRPRFSIKDYKSRLDYRNRMSSTTSETPSSSSVMTRHKLTALKNQQDSENQDVESTTATTGRYRHMSRVSHRVTPTTSTYHSRRNEATGNSTAERVNKFTPKRRLHANHLYRSKFSTSTTTEPSANDADSTTARHNSIRHENVYSSAIRRRPQMKHSVYTQSSDIKSTRKDATEMVPEETSFYPSAISQLLTEMVTNPSGKDTDAELSTQSMKENEENVDEKVVTTTSSIESSSSSDALTIGSSDDFQSSKIENSNSFEDSQVTSTTSDEDVGKTEALVKSDSIMTINSQLDDDLFAKASQSVADLTSSASALYDKPGMFKAVSVAPSGADSAIISSRFKIAQEKPTLPIEAFFHELSHKN